MVRAQHAHTVYPEAPEVAAAAAWYMGASPHRPESALRHWAFASPGVVILYFTAVQFSSPGQLREQFHYTVPLPQREFANNASREVGERGFILVNPNFVKPVLNTAHCRRDTLPHPEGVLEGGQLCDAGQASSMMLMAGGGGAGPREGAGARRWLLSSVGSMQRETMTVMSSFYSRPAGRRPSKCRPRRGWRKESRFCCRGRVPARGCKQDTVSEIVRSPAELDQVALQEMGTHAKEMNQLGCRTQAVSSAPHHVRLVLSTHPRPVADGAIQFLRPSTGPTCISIGATQEIPL